MTQSRVLPMGVTHGGVFFPPLYELYPSSPHTYSFILIKWDKTHRTNPVISISRNKNTHHWLNSIDHQPSCENANLKTNPIEPDIACTRAKLAKLGSQAFPVPSGGRIKISPHFRPYYLLRPAIFKVGSSSNRSKAWWVNGTRI